MSKPTRFVFRFYPPAYISCYLYTDAWRVHHSVLFEKQKDKYAYLQLIESSLKRIYRVRGDRILLLE